MNHDLRIPLVLCLVALAAGAQLPYVVVDTGQALCYDNARRIAEPLPGQPFFGQDGQYRGPQPSYRAGADGIVADLNTGLQWVSAGKGKLRWEDAVKGAAACRAGGHGDWRLPSIKELYSLILFSGTDPDPRSATGGTPFIDTRFFPFQYGRAGDGDRIIDSQFATATLCRDPLMNGMKAMFGVNFADGRIKGYPVEARGPRVKTYYVFYVRGNPAYGRNEFVDNGDGTVTDRATGLMWLKGDSGTHRAGPRKDGALDWEQALAWAEGLDYAGHADWRLPNAKELQSIVDYARSPGTTRTAAIDPVFLCSEIRNEGGQPDWPYYWTGTTHAGPRGGTAAVYLSFGRALGYMPDRRTGDKQLLDVHGAGAQRSDPKTGDPADYAGGRGPQGDVVRILNHVRCVRSAK